MNLQVPHRGVRNIQLTGVCENPFQGCERDHEKRYLHKTSEKISKLVESQHFSQVFGRFLSSVGHEDSNEVHFHIELSTHYITVFVGEDQQTERLDTLQEDPLPKKFVEKAKDVVNTAKRICEECLTQCQSDDTSSESSSSDDDELSAFGSTPSLSPRRSPHRLPATTFRFSTATGLSANVGVTTAQSLTSEEHKEQVMLLTEQLNRTHDFLNEARETLERERAISSDERNRLNKMVSQYQATIERIEGELIALRAQMEVAEATFRDNESLLSRRVTDLTSKLETAQATNSDLSANMEEGHRTFSEQQNALKRALTEKRALEATNSSLGKEIREKQQALVQLQLELDQNKTTLTQQAERERLLRDNLAAQDRVIKELQQLQTKSSSVESMLRQINTSLEGQLGRSQVLLNRFGGLGESELTRLSQENSRLQAENVSLHAKTTATDQALATAQRTAASARETLEHLRFQKEETDRLNQLQHEELIRSQTLVKDLTAKLQTAEKERERLSRDNVAIQEDSDNTARARGMIIFKLYQARLTSKNF